MSDMETELERLARQLALGNTKTFGHFVDALLGAHYESEALGIDGRRLAIVTRCLEEALLHAFAGQEMNPVREDNDAY